MRRHIHAFILVGLASCIGCGGQSSIPGLVRVSGTVTFKEQPIEGATVSFHPASGSRAASGRTDLNGKFEMTSLNSGDGALPGEYKVSISKVEDSNPAHQVTAEQFAQMVSGGKPPPTGPTKPGQRQKTGGLEYHVPEKYLDAEKSGLTAKVTSDGKNDFLFELK